MQYQIGDFAKMAQISHRQLKYYEQCGLITPVRIDEGSGYRFYEAEQLRDVSHIRAFLSMGFSTTEIKALLPDSDYAVAFNRKQKQLEQELEESRRRLALLNFYRDAIRQSGFNQPYRATVKTTPAGLVAAQRRVFPNMEVAMEGFLNIVNEIQRVGALPTASDDAMACFYDEEFAIEFFDAELLLPLEKCGGDSPIFEYKQLEPHRAVNVVHYGNYDFLHEAYAFAYMWADRIGYCPAGKPIEHYLISPMSERPENEFVTELYIPIED